MRSKSPASQASGTPPLKRFEHKLYEFVADLRQRLGARAPRDAEEVSLEEFGRVLKITLATKVRIEDEETARRLAKG